MQPAAMSTHAPSFYMYTSDELPLFHEELWSCMRSGKQHQLLNHQHTTGYWLHHQLNRHTARVHHKQDAKIFVVPFWMQLSWMVGKCGNTTHISRLLVLFHSLASAKSFRRLPHQHLLLCSSFMMREPPIIRPAVKNGCIGEWLGNRTNFGYFPKGTVYVAVAQKLIIGHMERYSAALCDTLIPGTNESISPRWPSTWWGSRTLVLPCA